MTLLGSAFRLLVMLVIAGHVFAMYGLARTWHDETGLTTAGTLRGLAFALVMLIPTAPAILLPESPEILRAGARMRRYRAGRCWACGYDVASAERAKCPECATDVSEPPAYRLGRTTVLRFAAMLFTAWLLGSAISEIRILTDERRFTGEVARHIALNGDIAYARPRAWPNERAMLEYVPAGE